MSDTGGGAAAPSVATRQLALASTTASEPTETTVPVTGFTTFGSVTPDARGFVVTEGASQNSGLTLLGYQFPAGTHSLRFLFQFTTPGDGDFLSMEFGDNPPIFVGEDMPLTRDGELRVDVPVEHLSGEQGDLVFRLVSRGQQNAVVTIHDIVAVTIEDLDHDGLTNAQETTLGTNPAKPDTDNDGLSDPDEVSVYQTDPLVGDTDGDGVPDGEEVAAGTDPKNQTSRLAMKSLSLNTGGCSLEWWAQSTKSYRVLRSTDPGFGSYDVIGTALPGASPSKSFLDSSIQPGAVPKIFFKIQLEPQP